jgi:hypothetical protein
VSGDSAAYDAVDHANPSTPSAVTVRLRFSGPPVARHFAARAASAVRANEALIVPGLRRELCAGGIIAHLTARSGGSSPCLRAAS